MSKYILWKNRQMIFWYTSIKLFWHAMSHRLQETINIWLNLQAL